MERIKLQNIVLSEDNSELYYHVKGNGLNADGYFNLFDIAQRKKYTEIEQVVLRGKATGYSSVTVMHNMESVAEYDLDGKNINDEIEITLPYTEYDDGVFWVRFNYSEDDFNRHIDAAFYGLTGKKRDAEICIGMCTYKREEDVKRNAGFVRKVISGAEEVAGHLSMYIIDNGHTLDSFHISEGEKSRIQIFANKNAGGASGFTRAMIEAMRNRKEKKFTHILLMDDDVSVIEDIFVRLYGVICTLKSEYKDIRIGGELFRKDFPWILNARGEWSERYLTESQNHLKDLRDMDECLDVICRTADDERLYTGWWCACYSLDMIEKTSLPLPLFIHDDDISFEKDHVEYKILFMNGISVWHNGFELSNYGANQYYHIRNKLIGSALFEQEIKALDVARWVMKCMVALLISYRYKEIEYIEKAVRDFMKGPEWLQAVDSEKLNSEILNGFRPYRMKDDDFDAMGNHSDGNLAGGKAYMSTDEIKEGRKNSTNDLGYGAFGSVIGRINDFREKYNIDVIKDYSAEDRIAGHMKEKLTLNGWILPAKHDYVEMTLMYSPFKAYRTRKIILFDPTSEKSVVLKKDYKHFFKSVGYIVKSTVVTGLKYSSMAKQYRKEKRFLASKENWVKLLNI